MVLLFLTNILKAQNLGFEALPATTPPNNWTAVTGTWTVNNTTVRTGTSSMTITDPATSGTTLGNTNPFLTTTSTSNFLITMGWGRSNTASNALFYLGYRSGTVNTITPTSTSAGQPANINNTGWSRVVSVSSTTVPAGSYGVGLRAFTSAASAGTQLFFDDIIMYASTSNVPDLTAPNSPTAVQVASGSVQWTINADNGSPASGIGGAVVVRANGVVATPPTLNSQAMYAVTSGASGSNSFTEAGTTWTVVGTTNDAVTNSVIDPLGGVGPFTYVVFTRDLAYNYSTGVIATAVGNCMGIPVAGTSVVSPAGIQCFSFPRTLGVSGSTFASGLSYQWQRASTLTGAYTNDGSVQSTSSTIINPVVTGFYRCIVKCGLDSTISTPVEVLVNSGLSGSFTINKNLPTGGNNFTSFADAVTAISCGITGPVTFTVAQGSGPYTEQVVIPSVNGVSSTNKITFKGNNESLTFTPTVSTNRHVLWLNGADHFVFDSLNIVVGGSVAGWGVVLTNQADSNIVRNCTINVGNSSSTSTFFIPIVINGVNNTTASSGNNGNGNIFEKNTILNGYYSFYLYGNASSTTQNTGNIFRNNIATDFYSYSVFATYASDGTIISKNDFSRPNRIGSTTTGGVSLSTGCRGVLIEKNKVHNLFDAMLTNTSITYGVFVGADAAPGVENKVINNLFYNYNGNGTHYGIGNSSGDHMQAYHNTIVMDNASATGIAYGLHQTAAATSVNFRNNLVYITKGGTSAKRCVYFVTTTSTIVSNKNVYYLNAAGGTDNHVGQFGTTNFTSLSNWQTANSSAYDAASLYVDPLFVDIINADFKPTEASINGIGDNVNVTSDFLDSTRNSNPDPGAYEFSIAGCTGPATAGVANASVTNICANTNFTLSLTGNSIGAGTTFQWQSSPNGTTSWTNLGTASDIGFITAFQNDTTFYRCLVRCTTGPIDTSSIVQVNTGELVNGAYTINNTMPTAGRNFNSFLDAVAALNCGVSGPVVFNVANTGSNYNERVVINQVPGTSATNTIKFNGNGSVISYSATTTGNRAIILLNGTDHITLDSFVVDPGTATNNVWGIVLMNKSDSVTIKNCTINIGNLASTSTTTLMGIVVNNSESLTLTSGDNANGLQILNNTFNGGGYSIYLVGNSASTLQNNNCLIRGNKFLDFYNYGIYAIYMSEGLVITQNEFSRPNRGNSTTAYGVFITTGCINALIERNKFHNFFGGNLSGNSIVYAIYTAADGKTGKQNKIINNIIYNFNGNGTQYGIGNLGGDSTQIYHNTIVLDDAATTSGAAYGIYQSTAATGIDIRNNIVSIRRAGTGIKRAIHFNTNTSTLTSNKNVLYLNAPSGTDNHLGQFGTTNYTTLANWQTANANAYDQGSLSTDPNFTDASTGNLKPILGPFDNLGDSLGVLRDFNDSLRSTTAPDPGAFEFALAGCINPVDAGSATTSATTICANTGFALNLSGNSIGAGITHQWQSSPNGTTGWTDFGIAQNDAIITVTQTDTTFYRCIVRCNAGPRDTSSIVQVNTANLISGTYTINNTLPSSATNFNSFGEAVAALNCGIAGPVIFNVVNNITPYNERVVINHVNGTSSTNTIKFNGNGATISFGGTTLNNRAIILLNGTDHIIFDSLMIDPGTATTNVWGIVLMNKADSVTIKNCSINMGNLTSTGTTTIMGIVVNGSESTAQISGDNANGLQILNNKISSGGYSIYLVGNAASTAQNNNCVIRGNEILDFYNYGIYALYMSEGLVISQNDFSRPRRGNSALAYGVSILTGCINALVEKNKFYNFFGGNSAGTQTSYAIYTSADGRTGKENRIINNLIYNYNGNGLQYGIGNVGADSTLIYHNTIVLDDAATTTGSSYGIHQTTTATGIDIRNNIISITRAGSGSKRALLFNANTSLIVSNKNVLHLSASGGTDNHLGQFGTTNFTTLANWRTANSNAFDQGSQSTNPNFTNAIGGDFKPTVGSSFSNLGDSVGVFRDINDSLRSKITPDPGAIEFSNLVFGTDIASEALVTPVVSSVGCYTSTEIVSIRVRNTGTNDIDLSTNPITVTTSVTGATTQVINGVANTGILKSDSAIVITMSTPLDMSTTGVYSINSTAVVTGDVNSNNNALPLPVNREKVSLSAGTVTISPSIFCGNGGTQPVLRTSGQTSLTSIQWQQSTTSNGTFTDISGATTNPYTVTTPLTQTLYYRAVATCGTQTNNSIEDTVEFVNPQILTTTPRYTCGTGTVTLSATASSGSTINWYAATSGGSALGTGSNFVTPSISATTTYYVAASTSGSVGASPIQITELDLGVDDKFEIQNVSPSSVDVTGWKIYVSNDYANINAVNPNVATLSGSLASGATRTYTDNTAGPNYWGSNILWNPGAFPTFSGWVIIVDNNNIIRDAVFLNWQAANISSMNVTLGGTAYTLGTQWSGNGVDIATVAATQSVSRKGSLDNNNSADFEIVNLTLGASNAGLAVPMAGFGCESARTAVVATVDNTPGCTPLPVYLLQFSGTKDGLVNKLQFTTANETNNKGFYIERSADGYKFSNIGYVATKAVSGSSTSNIAYNFIDEKPLTGNNYYRLKQEDKDGKTTLSNVVAIKGKLVNKIEIDGLYPNPANNQLTIQLSTPTNEKVTMVITDLQGKIVQQQPVNIASGNNNVNLNISNLSTGNYFIKAICNNGCNTTIHKFVKL
jgi:hypothetical protein